VGKWNYAFNFFIYSGLFRFSTYPFFFRLMYLFESKREREQVGEEGEGQTERER